MQLSPKVYVFLQALNLLVGFVVFVFLVAFPLTEGRAVGLSLVKIYMDPFILYLYGAALVFLEGSTGFFYFWTNANAKCGRVYAPFKR